MKKYCINESKVAWRDLDGETVILDLKTDTYFSLDKIGTKIWNKMIKKSEIKALVALITSSYEVTAKEAERDVEELISSLKKQGLILESAEK
ncbi:PqqD family protein [bacterium]|nr:PqqD family protein [bacterium]